MKKGKVSPSPRVGEDEIKYRASSSRLTSVSQMGSGSSRGEWAEIEAAAMEQELLQKSRAAQLASALKLLVVSSPSLLVAVVLTAVNLSQVTRSHTSADAVCHLTWGVAGNEGLGVSAASSGSGGSSGVQSAAVVGGTGA